MVESEAESLDSTFRALADPTRRAILGRLARGEAPIAELAEPFAMSLPAVCKHVKVLEQARLLKREKRGRAYYVRLDIQPLQRAARWIEEYERFWRMQLGALGAYLKEMKKAQKRR